MATMVAAEEWNWLFEEGGRLNWQAIIPDFAVIGRIPMAPSNSQGYSVLNPTTGAQDAGSDLLEVLARVCPEVEDWPGLMERLKQEKAEDPLDRLEAVAGSLETLMARLHRGDEINQVRQRLEDQAARIRGAIRRIRSVPQRARLSDQQVAKASEAIEAQCDVLGTHDKETVAEILRDILG